MEKCLGVILVVTGVSEGDTIDISLCATSISDRIIDAIQEIEVLSHENLTTSEIEYLEKILGSFVQMIGNFTSVMVNLNNPTAAATCSTCIVTALFNIIFEMAKYRQNALLMPLITENVLYSNNQLDEHPIKYLPSQRFSNSTITQAFLNNFTALMSNFTSIAADPHNPDVISSSIVHMFADALHIVTYLTGNCSDKSVIHELETLAEDEELKNIMNAIVINHAARAHVLQADPLGTGAAA